MAGSGPAPKPPEQRRRYNQPARSEWVELPAELSEPVIPPPSGHWSPAARRLYRGVRADPISTQYSKADIAALRDFMAVYDKLEPSEQRLRMCAFGITPKGRRDLRWRTPLEARQQEEAVAKAAVKRLRIADKAA